MKRYTASIGSTKLNTDDVNLAIEFAYSPCEQAGAPTTTTGPAHKAQGRHRLITNGQVTLDLPAGTQGSVTALVIDNLYQHANKARNLARELYACDGELEIDAGQPVHRIEDSWMVEVWVWVSAESADCEDLEDDGADEENIEAAYIAAAQHPDVEFKDNARASLGDDPGAYVSGWVEVSDDNAGAAL